LRAYAPIPHSNTKNKTKNIFRKLPLLAPLIFGTAGSSHVSIEFGAIWSNGCFFKLFNTKKRPTIKKCNKRVENPINNGDGYKIGRSRGMDPINKGFMYLLSTWAQ
jgi:hypothetical protein